MILKFSLRPLNTYIFAYNTLHSNWWRYGPHDVDRSLTVDITNMSMYIRNSGEHFDIVCDGSICFDCNFPL